MLPLWGEDRRASLELSLFGLPVRIHLSFLLFFVLLLGSGDLLWAGAGTAVFFVSILGHELGHAMAFQAFGAPRPLIVLHGMGGYTLAPEVAGRARRFVVSAAGPVAGFAVGYAGHLAGRDLDGLAGDAGELAWLVGCVWGLGNLLPVLPLDGGRIAQELLPGTEVQRLARARVLSVVVGGVLALVAWSAGYVFVAVLVAWFTFGNLSAVAQARRTGDRVVEDPRRIEQRLQLAFGALTPSSAPATESLAWEALQGAPAGGRAYPVSVLVSSLLVQQRHAEAAEVLARVDERDCSEYLRTLVALGPAAAGRLDQRLQTGRPDPADLDLALLARAFAQDWDAAAALAEWDEQGRLEQGWLELVTSWSFHAGAFAASARLGRSLERRDADARTSFNVACALARDGRPDEAVDALDRAAGRGWHDLQAADHDEDLAALRAHPGWAALRARFVENGRRPALERTPPVRRPTAAAAGFAACLLVVVGLVRVLPSEPDLRELSSEVPVLDSSTDQRLHG